MTAEAFPESCGRCGHPFTSRQDYEGAHLCPAPVSSGEAGKGEAGPLARVWDEGARAATMDYGIGAAVNPYRIPPPTPKTPEEKRAFSADWDARFDAWRRRTTVE